MSARVFSSILKLLMSSKLLFSLFLLLPIPIIYDIIKILNFSKLSFCGSSSSSSVGAGISVVLDVWPTTKSWILGFLEVFLVFLVLLGNSLFFAGNQKKT